MDEIGPVDYAVIASPGNEFKGKIAPALADLVEAGTIRLIDAAFVGKRREGQGVRSSSTELAPTCRRRSTRCRSRSKGCSATRSFAAGGDLEPNSSAALLVWENVWARKVAQAIRDAGGELVAFERVPHDVVQAAREFALEEMKA